MDLAALTYETAKGLEGTTFHVELPDGTRLPMTLKGVQRYGTPIGGKAPRRDPFSLFFAGPLSPILPQAMYALRGGPVSFEQLFIVPIGQGDGATQYEAAFS
jgi:Domain of unknown function (DUF6916)